MPNDPNDRDINAQHMRLLAIHVRSAINEISNKLAAQGAQLRMSEIYSGMIEVLLEKFITYEGFDAEKLQKFSGQIADDLHNAIARAKSERSPDN